MSGLCGPDFSQTSGLKKSQFFLIIKNTYYIYIYILHLYHGNMFFSSPTLIFLNAMTRQDGLKGKPFFPGDDLTFWEDGVFRIAPLSQDFAGNGKIKEWTKGKGKLMAA